MELGKINLVVAGSVVDTGGSIGLEVVLGGVAVVVGRYDRKAVRLIAPSATLSTRVKSSVIFRRMTSHWARLSARATPPSTSGSLVPQSAKK